MKETKNYIEATPEQVKEWEETDFFRSGNFSAMTFFVVIPAVIQIVVFFAMLGVFVINGFFF